MNFTFIADTDVGLVKKTNQDSVCVKLANTTKGQVIMAIICDGMGGLSSGEIASATVVLEFAKWFDESISSELEQLDFNVIAAKWELMLKDLNSKIIEYGKKINASLGTTFTGMLCIGENFLITHVGDTRVYHIDKDIEQLTEDQTVINRELKRGTITPEQAKVDSRRNMLLQCVGASKVVNPDTILGKIEKGVYMLCSDGFRHEIIQSEIFNAFNPDVLSSKEIMSKNVRKMIEIVKSRQERDNISVVLIKVD